MRAVSFGSIVFALVAACAAACVAACSLQRPADVNDDAGAGGCGGTCTAAAPVCTADTCGPCSSEIECLPYAAAGEPHCTSVGTCAECRDSADCGAAKPYCDAGACRACKQDSECASGACELQSGTCFPEDETLYVAINGTGDCSKAAPCGSLNGALGLVSAKKKYIKLAAGRYAEDLDVITGKTVTISGPGATITANSIRVALTVADNASVTVDDATIEGVGGLNKRFAAVSCDGLNAALTLRHVVVHLAYGDGVYGGNCTMTMERSLVAQNLHSGLYLNTSKATIVNNMIVGNGISTYGTAGVALFLQSGSRFEFNTVAGNTSVAGVTPGVFCNIGQVANNIVYGNISGTSTAVSQLEGSCTWSFSDVGPMPATGTMNIDPQFRAPASLDFTLLPGSAIRNTADPAASLDIDFQGEPRPQGAGREPGADEIP